VSFSADWDGTDVTLGDLTGTFAGTDISDDVDQAFSVLDNPADDLETWSTTLSAGWRPSSAASPRPGSTPPTTWRP
jgi:hypothetical protein